MVRYQNLLDAKTRNKVHIMGHGKHVFEHLAKKLGPNCLVTAEMVQSKFKDIGIAERKLGFESAHKICQDYVREQLRTKNEPFYPSQSVLEKAKRRVGTQRRRRIFSTPHQRTLVDEERRFELLRLFWKEEEEEEKTKKRRELP